MEISTHSPRVGRTMLISSLAQQNPHFNSLAPRGANLCFCVSPHNIYHFNSSTHSPRVGRTLPQTLPPPVPFHFNSLAPRGANHFRTCGSAASNRFQLTRPAWGEPKKLGHRYEVIKFQLTRPAWGEPLFHELFAGTSKFQLTRPAWGEPIPASHLEVQYTISTHSPRVGRTPALFRS